jgi:hypothetical protein
MHYAPATNNDWFHLLGRNELRPDALKMKVLSVVASSV